MGDLSPLPPSCLLIGGFDLAASHLKPNIVRSGFHGDSECVGHATMLCAKQVNALAADSKVDSYAWFDMVTCMNCGGPG